MATTSASAGGERTPFYNSETRKSLFSAGARGLGWRRNHPITEALFRPPRVDLGDSAGKNGGGRCEPCRLFRASYYHNLAVDARGQWHGWGCGTFVDEAARKNDGTPHLDGVVPALGPRARATATDRGEPPSPIALERKDPRVVGGCLVSLGGLDPSRNRLHLWCGAARAQLGRPIGPARTDSSGLPVDPKIVDGGYCHTLVKTVAGKRSRATATPVVLPNGRTAIDVAAGANHSVVLGDDGVAYTFGAKDAGRCGVSSSSSSRDSGNDEEGSPVPSPRAVRIPNDAGRVVGISAGYARTVSTTSKNRVFVFGQNDNGRLGIGGDRASEGDVVDSEPSLLPVEVNIAE